MDPFIQPDFYSSPADWLRAEFINRRKQNPQFSLRAMAKHLDLPPGRMSQLLSKKRPFTLQQGEKIADNLAYSPEQRQALLNLIVQSRKQETKHLAALLKTKRVATQYNPIKADQFHLIADWYHFALLSLIETDDFRPNVSWISKRLGVGTTEVRAALDRLERLGLIAVLPDSVKLVHADNAAYSEIPSPALRLSHKQSLEQAIAALDAVPQEERDITSITMAIDKRKIPEAKKIIKEFRLQLSSLLESGDRQEVYNLNIQLIPITRKV